MCSKTGLRTKQVEYVFQALAPLALGCVKCSIVFFYRRIFCATKYNTFDWATQLLVGTIILWAISFFLANVFQCGTNFAAVWAPLLVFKTECSKTLPLQEGYVISDTVLDTILLVLPLPKVCQLNPSFQYVVIPTTSNLTNHYPRFGGCRCQ